MIRASVEVKDENRAFSVAVYADNLQRAVEFAANRFPGCAVSVQFPLDPEVFFVEGPAVGSETGEPMATKELRQERGRDEAAETPTARLRRGSTVGTTSDLSIMERAAS